MRMDCGNVRKVAMTAIDKRAKVFWEKNTSAALKDFRLTTLKIKTQHTNKVIPKMYTKSRFRT